MAALRVCLSLFMTEVLRLRVGPHHEEWSDLLNASRRVAVLAARDNGKSGMASYAYPIHRAWADPGHEIYLFSATHEEACEFLDIIIYGKDSIPGLVNTPELAHLVPGHVHDGKKKDKRERLSRKDVRLTNGSRFRAVGYGKRVRGRHPKYIVLDDVMTEEDLYSPTVRAKRIAYLNGAIANMLPPDGQLFAVGTPMHAADLMAYLAKNPAYTARRSPGIVKDARGHDRPLWPWRHTLKSILAKKVEIGSVAFSREIMLQPISDDLAIFPAALFPPCFDALAKLRPSRAVLKEAGWTCYMGVDIAMSASVAADFFVMFVIGVDSHGFHHLVDIRRHKGMPFHKQLSEIERWAKHYDCQLVLIESNQAQRVWSDEMKRTTDVPVKEFLTGASNKYALDKGIPSLRILLENEKVVIPRGDQLSIILTDIWMAECQAFGFIDGKLQGAGEHDDTVMGWWFASEARKMGGFSFGSGDEDADADAEMAGEGGDIDWEAELIGTDDEDDDGATRVEEIDDDDGTGLL
jgi:hypothetical protein